MSLMFEANHQTATAGNDNQQADVLKQQVLVNHFEQATGCSEVQSLQILHDARWDFELALSIFFQETSAAQTAPVATRAPLNPLCAPCNTPATPPQFDYALAAFAKMQCTQGSQPDELSVLTNNNNNNNNITGNNYHQTACAELAQTRSYSPAPDDAMMFDCAADVALACANQS